MHLPPCSSWTLASAGSIENGGRLRGRHGVNNIGHICWSDVKLTTKFKFKFVTDTDTSGRVHIMDQTVDDVLSDFMIFLEKKLTTHPRNNPFPGPSFNIKTPSYLDCYYRDKVASRQSYMVEIHSWNDRRFCIETGTSRSVDTKPCFMTIPPCSIETWNLHRLTTGRTTHLIHHWHYEDMQPNLISCMN